VSTTCLSPLYATDLTAVLYAQKLAPPKKKLTKLEEATIVKRILDLDLRGFPPTKAILHDIANKLLEERDASTVGKNWLDNFVNHKKELKIC